MDSEGLHLTMEYLSGSGIVLSPEQKAALQTSLVIVKTNYKFEKVKLWGKILGLKDDYFICQGSANDEMKDTKYLYSLNCFDWHLLPLPTADSISKSAVIRGRITGDPTYEYEHTDIRRVKDGDEYTDEEVSVQVKEEHRLAAIISTIDEDANVVPRGAYIKTPLNQVHTNRSFEGLSVTESGKLSSYMHFRATRAHEPKTIQEKADLEPSIDFMDTIENDIPRGTWSLQYERGSGLVTLRNLQWVGFTFYHVPNTRKFGCVYVGTGERNFDIPFML